MAPAPSLTTKIEIATVRVSDLRPGAEAILESIELAEEEARHLMVLGFLPGHRIQAGFCAPGGDPRIYRVDGSEVALRNETAHFLIATPISGEAL